MALLDENRQEDLENFLWEKGVKNGVFPGSVLVYGYPLKKKSRKVTVGYRGLSRNKSLVNLDTVYDLASITKVMATTILVMKAIDQKRLSLKTTLGQLGLTPKADLSLISLTDLLSHQSGLAPWRPFFSIGGTEAKKKVISALMEESPKAAPGELSLYSDLNFMLLGFILEEVYDEELKNIFAKEISIPLGINSTFCPQNGYLAPTEDGFRKAGPLDLGLSYIQGPVPLGHVHDDNASFLGGQAGHAGLFSSSPDLWKIIEALAESIEGQKESSLVSISVINEFLREKPAKRGPLRALGFDIRAEGPLKGAVGHLGYTGGSFWWDWKGDRAYVFLTNRVHPTARNNLIIEFRKDLEIEIFEK